MLDSNSCLLEGAFRISVSTETLTDFFYKKRLTSTNIKPTPSKRIKFSLGKDKLNLWLVLTLVQINVTQFSCSHSLAAKIC